MYYDRIKQDVRSAETLAAALASGMQIRFEAPGSGKGVITSFASESDFYAGLSQGYTYHIETPKRRRPWTREEAEAHLGCVLVPPDRRSTNRHLPPPWRILLVERRSKSVAHPAGRGRLAIPSPRASQRP